MLQSFKISWLSFNLSFKSYYVLNDCATCLRGIYLQLCGNETPGICLYVSSKTSKVSSLLLIKELILTEPKGWVTKIIKSNTTSQLFELSNHVNTSACGARIRSWRVYEGFHVLGAYVLTGLNAFAENLGTVSTVSISTVKFLFSFERARVQHWRRLRGLNVTIMLQIMVLLAPKELFTWWWPMI